MDSLCPRSEYTVPERTTQQFLLTLKDYAGVVIPLASMTTITLTLYKKSDGSIINARNDSDIKNATIGTYHATSGLLIVNFVPADMAIIDDNLSVEEHIALVEWTYTAGANRGQHEALYSVVNSLKVP